MSAKYLSVCLLLAAVLAGSAMADDNPRQVSVSGSGEVTVVPDMATLVMGVELRGRELEPVKDQVSGTVTDFLTMAEKLGIDRKQLNTSQLTVRPEYDWNNTNRQRRLTGFYVQRQIQVELRDLELLGSLMERATGLGVNQVSGPYFRSSREKALEREALKAAALDARLNAEALSATLGASLGPVRSIQSGGLVVPRPPMPQGRAMMAESMAADQSYEVGEMKISAQVSVVFDLLPED